MGQTRDAGVLDRLDRAAIGFGFVRDEIYWSLLEGRDGFDWSYCDGYVAEIAARGTRLLLTVDWSNPLHQARRADGGPPPQNGVLLPDTEAERAAFARYVVAVLQRYAHPSGARYTPGLILAVEVWNEANGSWSGGLPIRPGPGGVAEQVAALTSAVHAQVRAERAYDAIPVLGGACVKVPLNYVRWLLEAGLGAVVDGLAIHPYLEPESLMSGVQALRALLDARGLRRVGLWATEFGDVQDGDALLRLLAAVKASPIVCASAYQAQDRDGTGGGLLDRDGAPSEAGRTWARWFKVMAWARFVGRRRSQPRTYLLAFETADGRPFTLAWTRWGVTELRLGGAVTAHDAAGRRLAVNGHTHWPLDRAPIVVSGPGAIEEVGANDVLADAFADFQTPAPKPGWRHLAYAAAGETPLVVTSDAYGDFYGDPRAPLARLDATTAHPGAFAGQALAVARSFTPPSPGRVRIQAQARRLSSQGDGSGVWVRAGGRELLRQVLKDVAPVTLDVEVELGSGEAVAFATDPGPGLNLDFDAVAWDIMISRG